MILFGYSKNTLMPLTDRHYKRQNWAPATSKAAALPLFGKKSSGAAAYRYVNEKAYKTAAAAATSKK